MALMGFRDFKDKVYDELEKVYRIKSIDDSPGWLVITFENGYTYHGKRALLELMYRTYYNDEAQFEKVFSFLSEAISTDILRAYKKI